MTSNWTRTRDAGFAIARPARALAALLLAVLALPVKADAASAPGTAQSPRPLVIGLTCEGSASPVRESHYWDSRVPVGGAPEQCLDGNTKLRLTPRHVALEYNRATESFDVVLTISEADGRKVGDLFAAALKTGTRHDLILVDGKVIVSTFIFGQFSGTALMIGAGSDDTAKAIAAVLSGS